MATFGLHRFNRQSIMDRMSGFLFHKGLVVRVDVRPGSFKIQILDCEIQYGRSGNRSLIDRHVLFDIPGVF